ncbi:hypothetical protein GCM10017576_23400 [Microbacterium barkeri]|uniref:Uncharacterized protein n=1 Tax=Microbacterium barkeri TaxID=33917 RepID=A0A9W6H515_9MICO|nr:hypothetical protein [Microbacterium barkeri]MDI6944197.1 hypothetical protein [Microbacterium barkeri]MDR6876769.1 hypothetical protein [Microbacterium barkeri]GLJ62210.1 hypothetical protein GCM10017576_23400 [Microbacterium barkeri]
METRILLNISDNGGYAPDQINTSFTLGKLLEGLNQAIETFGEDAVIVLSNGQRYGAGYGSIIDPGYGDLFYTAEDGEDD